MSNRLKKDFYALFNNELKLQIKKIEAVFLTPVRVKTLNKIVELIRANRELKNLNISSIRFKSRHAKPSVVLMKKEKTFDLVAKNWRTYSLRGSGFRDVLKMRVRGDYLLKPAGPF